MRNKNRNAHKLAHAERVKKLRVALNMTTREFGQLFGKSNATICQWENGNTKIPEIAIRLLEFHEKEHADKLKHDLGAKS